MQHLSWKVGDVRITRIQELEAPGMVFILPDATKENLAEIPWMAPHFVDAGGQALGSIHALVIETPSKRIVVDTCVGNDKPRRLPTWNQMQTDFLRNLEDAGLPAESIDNVVCTHLHVDHVGWNTRLVEGKWVPTFASAEYLFGRTEWEHWNAGQGGEQAVVMADSVQPVLDAGLATLVETDHRLCDEVFLEPTPGHTPGHVSVRISSKGHNAVITGDLIHHPCQIARPHYGAVVDSDSAQARKTRDAFLARYADTPTLVIGTHFAGPTAGHLVRDGNAYRLDV